MVLKLLRRVAFVGRDVAEASSGRVSSLKHPSGGYRGWSIPRVLICVVLSTSAFLRKYFDCYPSPVFCVARNVFDYKANHTHLVICREIAGVWTANVIKCNALRTQVSHLHTTSCPAIPALHEPPRFERGMLANFFALRNVCQLCLQMAK